MTIPVEAWGVPVFKNTARQEFRRILRRTRSGAAASAGFTAVPAVATVILATTTRIIDDLV